MEVMSAEQLAACTKERDEEEEEEEEATLAEDWALAGLETHKP